MVRSRALAGLVVFSLASALAMGDADAAGEDRIAVGEVSVAAPAPGLDSATLKSTAEGEIKTLDQTKMKGSKHYIIALAVVRSSDGPVSCEVTAMLREAKSGAMLAVIQGRARSEGGADAQLRTAVLRAAVRTAVRQIPEAIKGGS